MMRSVVVVGAGAAGLTAALRAAEAGARVTLLNAHPRIGLKILMSGGTRCNVTHREVTERDFNGGSQRFVRHVLRAFPAERAREWLEGLGVALKLEETGKYFPVSDNAKTVLDALVGAVKKAGVEVLSGRRVIRIEPPAMVAAGAEVAIEGGSPSAPRFRLGVLHVPDSAALAAPSVRGLEVVAWPLPEAEPNEWLEADAVILATGGLSFPRTGSDGTGYALATALGHTLVAPIPALTPLAAADPLCASAQGVTLDAELTLWSGGKREITIAGSLLVTHFGFSGPAALDLSRHWLRAESRPDRRVTVSFFPGFRVETLLASWRDVAAAEPRLSVRRYLARSIPDRLAVELCREVEIDPAMAMSQVDRVNRGVLIGRMTERPIHVTGTLGYEKAEVTAGGVALDEVDSSTLESKVVRGLYLCGEILDVEGRLGGFNFQWSWSSGTVAGRAAAK